MSILIANVAVHPDYRRRRIGRTSPNAIEHAREKKPQPSGCMCVMTTPPPSNSIKFGISGDRPPYHLDARPDPFSPKSITILRSCRDMRISGPQRDWLRRLYPDALGWYHAWNFNALRPGYANWLYLLFVDYSIKQWAAVRGDELLATLTWMPQGGRSETMYAATGPNAEHSEALTQLLIQPRRTLSSLQSFIGFPAGEMTDAIIAAGFQTRRTLIWMRA